MSVSPGLLEGPYASVFDVGAFIGEFALACLQTWNCQVDSFEPLLNVDPPNGNWRWHQVALGAERGTATIYRSTFLPSSSLLKMGKMHEDAFPYTKGGWEQQVPVETLDSWQSLIEEPALLKIDTQGYELEVLKGARKSLKFFEAVVLEMNHAPLYEGLPLAGEVETFLKEAGFEHVRRVDELRDPRNRGRLLQSDELYAR